jgi:hypothetical protein
MCRRRRGRDVTCRNITISGLGIIAHRRSGIAERASTMRWVNFGCAECRCQKTLSGCGSCESVRRTMNAPPPIRRCQPVCERATFWSPTTTKSWPMGKNGQSALAGVQRQLVGQLVKYRRTTRLRLNKCLGDDLAPPLPAAKPISDNTRIIYGCALGCAQLQFSRCFSPDRFGWPQRSLAL